MARGKPTMSGRKEPIPLTIVIVGEGGTGKSSITLSFIRREFLEDYDPTIEDSYSTSLVVDGQEYSIEIIDTAGQEEYRGLWGENTVQHGDAFLVVYSIDSKQSFNALPDFLQTIRNVKNVDFIDEDEEVGEETERKNNCFPFAIVANKSDLADSREVSWSEGSLFAAHTGSIFSETSAKTATNIESTFEELIRSTMRVRRARERNPRLIPNIGVIEDFLDREGGEGGEGKGKDWEGVMVDEGGGGKKSKNKDLRMDRRRSFSVGGLGGDPDKLGQRGCSIPILQVLRLIPSDLAQRELLPTSLFPPVQRFPPKSKRFCLILFSIVTSS
ncbi:ras-domain-containing protein [Atractiella rhizophila]|nr:ras-domain-containing protein [Atractiella rhizophila]